MMKTQIFRTVLFMTYALLLPVGASPDRDAARYIAAIKKINEEHVKKPGKATEDELVKKIPKKAVVALARVLKEKPSDEAKDALLKCGEASLDLAALDHFNRIRTRLVELDPEAASQLGQAMVRERFLVHGIGDLKEGYLEEFANITDAVLDAYDEVFAFKEWSKVPGKKIRILVHLEEKITRPPHFAPQFPYHSQIDLPVINAEGFHSPTPKGHMMFYGLCHELGHLIAMWGNRRHMEDHHAWAHYTGVVIVEHMAKTKKYQPIIPKLRDVRWRSLTLEKKKPANQIEPSTKSRASVMALLIKLHETAGPKAIGAALNLMDEKSMGHRINHVRYYSFENLGDALKRVVKDPETKRSVQDLFKN